MKEYDTLTLVCDYRDNEGALVDLSDVDITADIKSSDGNLYEPLVVKKYHSLGGFGLSRVANYLPAGEYLAEVLFTQRSVTHRVASDTFYIVVEQAITLPRS